MKRLLLLTSAIAALVFASCQQAEYKRNVGYVFGTSYNIIYKSNVDYEDSILAQLTLFGESLSTYNPLSTISKINDGTSTETDEYFRIVFNKAAEINKLSDGAFDITVSPLSSLWHFESTTPDTISKEEYNNILSKVDSVLQFVGMDKVYINENNQLIRSDNRIRLDACALAEGFGIDLAAQKLEDLGVTDYLVEIGGEIHIKGVNRDGEKWRVGIDKPIENKTLRQANRPLQYKLALTDCAVSTSGSYRQFYYTADGKRIAHTIDPRTGHPIEHGMLSATVIGPNTITTDALSTSFMVLGAEKAMALANSIDGIEAYIIYQLPDGSMHEDMTEGFQKLIINK